MTIGFFDNTRQVLRISGADRVKFLQDLVTNDLAGMADGLVYAALLSPQGKYLFDFFLLDGGDSILLDVAADRAAALAQRLNMYRLRADVQIDAEEIKVWCGLGEIPIRGFADPRNVNLGWRYYGGDALEISDMEIAEMEALRVEHIIPKSGAELVADETYILEAGFEGLNGVDFRKGCYVGQEITARMKHKTELKKGLVKVVVTGDTPECGAEITSDGKPAGRLFTVVNGFGLAHLRFARATGDMHCGDAILRLA